MVKNFKLLLPTISLHWKTYASVLVSTILFLSLIPIKFEPREVMPYGMHRIADFNNLTAVPVGNSVVFKIAITGDLELLHKPIYAEDLSNKKLLESLPPKILNKPDLLIKRLGFKFGTYNQELQCKTLELEFDDGVRSLPTDCKKIADNQIAYFDLKDTIRPGIHQFRIIGDLLSPLAAYSYNSPQGEKWLPVHYQKADSDSAHLLWDWVSFNPMKGIIYFFLVGTVGAFFINGQPSASKYFILIFLVATSFVIVIPFFSGHDETAHITMLERSLFPGTNEPEFNNLTNDSMIENDFFRLHNARLLQPGECPHKILFVDACGDSQKPQNLYRMYGRIITFLKIPILNNPDTLLWLGRAANLFWIAVATICLFTVFGESAMILLIFYFLTVGSFLGQVASISNDPPMFLIGFCLAVGIAISIQNPQKKNWLFIPALIFAFYYGRSVDRSAVAALPGIFALIGLMPLPFVAQFHKAQFNKSNFLLYLATTLILIVAGLHFELISKVLSIDFVSLVTRVTDDVSLLFNLNKFSFVTALLALQTYTQSALGSFIWGHSDIPNTYSFVVTGVIIVFSVVGIGYLKFSNTINRTLCALLGILIATQSLIVLIAQMANFGDPLVVFNSFLKVRLTAPGLGAFLIPASLALLQLNQKQSFRIAIFRILCFWTILWQCYLLPYAILKELY